jgi:malate dehydrogenase
VPTILGGNGIESVIEIPLTIEEKAALDKSVKSVQNVMGILETAKVTN